MPDAGSCYSPWVWAHHLPFFPPNDAQRAAMWASNEADSDTNVSELANESRARRRDAASYEMADLIYEEQKKAEEEAENFVFYSFG